MREILYNPDGTLHSDTGFDREERIQHCVSSMRQTAHKILSETDYYTVRLLEQDTPIPQDILDHRERIRRLTNQVEATIEDWSQQKLEMFNPEDPDNWEMVLGIE